MIHWPDIDTVLFDMDGTLLDLHFDTYFWSEHLPRRYAAIHQRDEQHCRQHLGELVASERGTLNWYCLDFWSERLQLDIPALKREIAHLIAVRPHVPALLQQLRDSGKKLLLVTNAHRDSLDIKIEHTGIDRFFDAVVVSHDYHAPKELQQFWQQMMLAQPFDPDRSLLVDDTHSVLASAKQYGIKHLLTLLQPDSHQRQRPAGDFPGIVHFDEIMPVTLG
ncbi:MAG: HAD superfamily hydrolase (TIGR01509 family) [Paraglaciecola psychrophila]|jgi:HAD superfamily hydrolase (TIGR01509 family)